ncbi:hypothetical protein BN946_scf184791.g6 [Trametes cinnabarina]|uniref:Uncharacterized protein n=1 Tax=Pycnoporus cinnabarinus TaxID=5643 RepID=A0A060S5G4_PYCCI|nr:hypothetical protein BN946_scf184791.g6 [Trametes cinnabarina]
MEDQSGDSLEDFTPVDSTRDEAPIVRLSDSMLLYLSYLHEGVNQLFSICCSACLHPNEVFGRPHMQNLVIKTPPESIWRILLDEAEYICAGGTTFLRDAAVNFVTAPWQSPEDHARRLYVEKMRATATGNRLENSYYPTPDRMVRVKWYPDLEAPLKPWPEEFAELWIDLPIQSDGSLDLRPLKRIWGMENVYVIDASHGRRLRIGRKPDEVLSALAWSVLLGRHSVLGVVEVTSPPMSLARTARAFIKQACTDPALWLHALQLAGLTAITLCAIAAFALWHVASAVLGVLALVLLCGWLICAVPVLSAVGICVTLLHKVVRWRQRAARRRLLLSLTRGDQPDRRSGRSSIRRLVDLRPVLQQSMAAVTYLGGVLAPWMLFAALSIAAVVRRLLLELYCGAVGLGQGPSRAGAQETAGESDQAWSETGGADDGEEGTGEHDGGDDGCDGQEYADQEDGSEFDEVGDGESDAEDDEED